MQLWLSFFVLYFFGWAIYIEYMTDDKDTIEDKAVFGKDAAGEKIVKEAPEAEKGGFRDAGLLEPTRFGDWDVKGRCSDF